MARILLAISLSALSACATPAERAAETARVLGLTREVVRGTDFDHVIYSRGADGPASILHVYIEGDGPPTRALRTRPPDPTPSDALMLRLLAKDPAPSALLGRPCYHGANPCSAWTFTVGRFGEEVVGSMVAALRRLRSARGAESVVLIGHSGGGALAMLMAERLPETRAVVTVAGNLDVGAWTSHHGYAPLAGSLDPALRPPLDPSVRQIHLVGGRDRRVPPTTTAAAIARQPGARPWRFPGFDHDCCWEAVWPTVLAELDRDR